MSAQYKTVSIIGENQYSGNLVIGGRFNVSLSGTWVAIVTVQRSFDGGLTWLDVATFSANGEYVGREIEDGIFYRLGVKTGDYTSGTITGRLSQ